MIKFGGLAHHNQQHEIIKYISSAAIAFNVLGTNAWATPISVYTNRRQHKCPASLTGAVRWPKCRRRFLTHPGELSRLLTSLWAWSVPLRLQKRLRRRRTFFRWLTWRRAANFLPRSEWRHQLTLCSIWKHHFCELELCPDFQQIVRDMSHIT